MTRHSAAASGRLRKHLSQLEEPAIAIVKGNAQVLAADGSKVARGMTYLHLPRGRETAQSAGGTVSCTEWHPDAGEPSVIAIENGPTLTITVSREAVSECSHNHILRYTTQWQPQSSSALDR